MGYTHYWYYNRELTTNEWQGIIKGFQKLMMALPDVPLANVDGTGKPAMTRNTLAFNGLAPHVLESFELFRTRKAWAERIGETSGRKWRGSCKTGHQPYDLTVMAVLLIVSEIAPGALNIESDEKMDGSAWQRAREVLKGIK